jgi:hypothetical protein
MNKAVSSQTELKWSQLNWWELNWTHVKLYVNSLPEAEAEVMLWRRFVGQSVLVSGTSCPKINIKIILRQTASHSLPWCQATICEPWPIHLFFFIENNFRKFRGFFIMWRPLWRVGVSLIYCHVPGMGSVTNNSTWIRIGYRIYSLWRFTAAHNTITGWYNNSQLNTRWKISLD